MLLTILVRSNFRFLGLPLVLLPIHQPNRQTNRQTKPTLIELRPRCWTLFVLGEHRNHLHTSICHISTVHLESIRERQGSGAIRGGLMIEQVQSSDPKATACPPVELQDRIVEYAVQAILEESTPTSKAVALSFGLVSRAAYDTVTRLVYKKVLVHLPKSSSDPLSCKQADALAQILTTNSVLARQVHVLSVYLASRTDPCCKKWFTAITCLIRASELMTLILDANFDFCQPLPFVNTARLKVLRLTTFQTDALQVNPLHYWLAVISDAASTLEDLEILGNLHNDGNKPFDLPKIPLCLKLKTLSCSSRTISTRRSNSEQNSGRTFLYQALLHRHAATIQEIDFSPFQDDLRPISVQVATPLPELRKVTLWYWNTEEEADRPINLLASTQQLMDLSAFSSIRVIRLFLYQHNAIKEMLQSCILCLERHAWLPHLQVIKVLVFSEATEDDLDITMGPQAATCGFYNEFKTLCTARGVMFSLSGMLPTYLDPDVTED